MTSFEQRQLADIERRLSAQYPELQQILAGTAASAARRRMWRWAGGLTALVSAVLLVLGLCLGSAALAVTAGSPPLTYGLAVLWGRRHPRGVGPRTSAA